jgi:hypothetical protein
VYWGCYAAIIFTNPLFAHCLSLENGHLVLPKPDHAVAQGLQSKHHFQAMGDL